MAGQADEREKIVAALAERGWHVARVTRSGYYVMRCGCGQHQRNLPKTPSNRNTFRNKMSRMLNECSQG